MGFANSIIGGASALIRAAIRSPNYVAGVSGWSANKDGSGEFNNLTLRGIFDGTNYEINASGIFFYSTTPGFGTLQYTLTVTAGTDQYGNTFLAGFTIYLPTSATAWNALNINFIGSTQDLGELIFFQSATGAGGTYTSAYSQIFRASGIEFTGPVAFDTAVTSNLTVDGEISAAVAASANAAFAALVSGDADNRWQLTGNGLMQWGPGNTAPDVRLHRTTAGGAAGLAATLIDADISGTGESWHNLAIPSGWSDHSGNSTGFQYAMAVFGVGAPTVMLSIDLNTPSSAPANGTVLGTLPAAYWPATTRHVVLAGKPGSSGQTPHLDVNTAGQILCESIAASDVISATPGFFRLD